jgi:hypothetical protein
MEHERSAAEERIRRAIQAKLGEAIRSLYELARPLPDRLYALVKELERHGATTTTSDQANDQANDQASEPKPPADHSTQGSDSRS